MNIPLFYDFSVVLIDKVTHMEILYNRYVHIMFKVTNLYLDRRVCMHWEREGFVSCPSEWACLGREFGNSLFDILYGLRDVCHPEFSDFVEIQQG